MTINELIQKRAKVWETAKNFVDTHENENGILSAEDSATYGRMEQEIEDLTAAIDRQQRADAREQELNKAMNQPLTGRPSQKVEEKTGRASNAYKEDFGAHLRGKRLEYQRAASKLYYIRRKNRANWENWNEQQRKEALRLQKDAINYMHSLPSKRANNKEWPGFESLRKEIKLEFGEYPVRAYQYSFPGQYGTHVDVPGHADVNGRTLEKIDIKECVLPLCVINCSDKVKMNSDYALSLDDIHDYEKIYGKIPKGAFVAMRSDWGKRWPSQEKFQNMDEYGEQHYPGWSLEAVKYLIEKRDVTAIGHETFDTDPPFCKEQRYFQAECYVLKQDRYQIEMLTNLDKIPERGAIIFCIFVKQTNGTGFPVRCFAICPNK